MSVIEFPRRPVRPIPEARPEPKRTLPPWQDFAIVGVCFALVVIAQWVLL